MEVNKDLLEKAISNPTEDNIKLAISHLKILVTKKPGRPRKYFSEEEKLEQRKKYQATKNDYNKIWRQLRRDGIDTSRRKVTDEKKKAHYKEYQKKYHEKRRKEQALAKAVQKSLE